MSSFEFEQMARLLAELNQRVSGLEGERRLGNASLENAGINEYDLDGKLVSRVGKQYDGTHGAVTLGGPKPPTPTGVEVFPGAQTAAVIWNGEWIQTAADAAAGRPTVAPMDWTRAEVHVAETPDLSGLLFATLKGTIESPRGGRVDLFGLVPGVDYWVRVVARSASGATSAPSDPIGPFQVTLLGVEEIDVEKIGGNRIHRGEAAPDGEHKVGDLWLKVIPPTAPETEPTYQTLRWAGAPKNWEPVPDQRATEALREAFAANETAVQAGLDALAAQGVASDAQGDATAALGAAQGAQGTASQALTDAGLAAEAAEAAANTAAGKTTTFRQDSPPSSDGRVVGDEWIETDQANRLHVWTGTWTLTRYGAGAISATARQLGAITTYRQASAPTSGMLVGDFWIDSDDNVLYRYEGATPTWVKVQDANIIAAVNAAATAQSTADGKVRIFPQPSPPTGLTADDVGDLWIDTDDSNVSYTWGITDGTTYGWVPRRLGNAAIEPKSLVARDVIATGTVSAALLEATLVLATTIIAGDPDGTHARMTPTGFRVFRADANGDGIPDEVVRLGTDTNDNLAIVKADGSLAASVDERGRGNFAAVSSQAWPEIGSPDHTGRGGSLLEILDRRPRGLVNWGSDAGTYDTNTSAGRGIFDVAARLHYSRMYKIVVRCRVNGTVHNDPLAEIQIRYSQSPIGTPTSQPTPPASPTINSQIAGRHHANIARAEGQGVYFEKLFSLGSGLASSYRDMRFLLMLTRPVGGTTITMWGPDPDGIEMWIEDVGRFVPSAATVNNGGGGVVVAPQKQRYSRTWVCNWHQNWLPNGAFIDLPGASQGRDPSNGNIRSYLGFSGVATDGSGLTMDQALAGAQIDEVGLYLHAFHWYYNAGGEAVIGMHGYRDPAPSFGGGNEWMYGSPNWPKPGGRWISLGGLFPQNWASGVWKGIMLGAAGADDFQHYGRFDAEGVANSPQINISYWR